MSTHEITARLRIDRRRAVVLETGYKELTVGRDEFLSTLNIIRVNNSKGVADSCQSADCVKLRYTEFIKLCRGNGTRASGQRSRPALRFIRDIVVVYCEHDEIAENLFDPPSLRSYYRRCFCFFGYKETFCH